MVRPSLVGAVNRDGGNLRRSARLQAKIAESAECVNNGRKIEPPKKSQNSRPKRKKQSTSQDPIDLETENTPSQVPPSNNWADTLKWLQKQRDVGLWIQCCREYCGKWRYNADIHDPVDVPEIWYCDMNSDRSIASCDCPNEQWPPGALADTIENKYNAGSIVWAHLDGYPWWPAMVDDSPTSFSYYQLPKNSTVPVKYNVTFLQEDKVEYAWIPTKNLHAYKTNPKEIFLKRKRMTYRGISFKDQVLRACEIADRAIEMSIRERLENFGFVARWPGNDSTGSQPQSSKQNSAKRPRSPKENSTSGRLRDDEITPVSSRRRSTRNGALSRAENSTSGSQLSSQPITDGSYVSGTLTPSYSFSTAYSIIPELGRTLRLSGTSDRDSAMIIDEEDDVDPDWQSHRREEEEEQASSEDSEVLANAENPEAPLLRVLVEEFYPKFLEDEELRMQNVSGIPSQASGASRACTPDERRRLENASGTFSQAFGDSRVFAGNDCCRIEHSSGFCSQSARTCGRYTTRQQRCAVNSEDCCRTELSSGFCSQPTRTCGRYTLRQQPCVVDNNATVNIAEDFISLEEYDMMDYEQKLRFVLSLVPLDQ